MSRFRILAPLVVALALAAALSACGGGSSSPEQVVEDATFRGIESADVDLSTGLDVTGKKGGHVDISLSGPFQSEGEDELPKVDLTATAKGSLGGEDVDFDGGITLLEDVAYVQYEGTEYEVDSTTYGFAKSIVRRPGKAGEPREVTACQEGLSKLQVSDFIEGATDEGSVDVGGSSTTKVSGDLNAAGALGELIKLTEDPDCSGQLKLASGSALTTESLKRDKEEVEDSVKQARVELYVGDDDIVRRLAIEATIEPPPGSGRESAKRTDVDFDLTLTGVNEEQPVSAPRNSQPLSKLFLKLGVNPIELLGLLEGQEGALLDSGGLDELLGGLGAGGNR